MIDIPGYLPQEHSDGAPLYESERTLVYRAIREADEHPVILKLLKQSQVNSRNLARFRREYDIMCSLKGDGIINAHTIDSHEDQWFMVQEDFDGIPLDPTGSEYDLEAILKIAVRMTQILGWIHQHNVIHKDIHPSNILYNSKSGQIRLIDFGISTPLSEEFISIVPHCHLQGTPTTMSPEQTGRMNRSIDYRSDFYSLGATLYQLMTNQLPFPHQDPLDLLHCHLAQIPTPPHVLNPKIPRVLSDIVMKLMEKAAEDRYQTTFGLKLDLEVCLAQLQAIDSINTFPLAAHDSSDRFRISQNLFGREEEIETLLGAFERVTQTNEPEGGREMVMVTGDAGIGKSALIHEIHKPIVEKRGYFISGKFDQFQRDSPFSSLIQAFRGLIRQFLCEEEKQIAVWRKKLMKAMGNQGRVVTEVIPDVELIIGAQPELSHASRTESQNRFKYLFQNFIRALTSFERPLTIFLDDMQWADPASLQMLELFMNDPQTQGLLLIGAYRKNETSAKHALIASLENIKQTGAHFHEIHLSSLSLDAINQMLAQTFQCSLEVSLNLALVCFEKTQGNPFFLRQFLHSLYVNKLVEFKVQEQNWHWQIEAIYQAKITDNVVELMAGKIQKLPQETQHVLQLAACLGSPFELETLSQLLEKSPEETEEQLRAALSEGLIVVGPVFQKQSSFKFFHDRIQEAAYSLLTDSDREEIHLKIGRRLDNPFDAVNHLNKAERLIEKVADRKGVVELNLEAGAKAKKNLAYSAAVGYIQKAISLSSDQSTVFALRIELAEAYFLNSDFKAADQLFSNLLQNVGTNQERIRVYMLQIEQLLVERKYAKAVSSVGAALSILNIEIPQSEEEAAHFFEEELKAFPQYLGKRRFTDLINEPKSSNVEVEQQIALLANLAGSAYSMTQYRVRLWADLKRATLCLQNGHLEAAAFSYICYASSVLVGHQKEYLDAFDYGEMALALSEKNDSLSYRGRIFFMHAIFINPIKKSISESVGLLRKSIPLCIEEGDFTYGAGAILWLSICQIISGVELQKILDELNKYLPFIKLNNKTVLEDMITPLVIQVVESMMGKAPTRPTQKEPLPKDQQSLTGSYLNCTNVFTLTLFGKHEEALTYLDKLGGMDQKVEPILRVETCFYMALTLIATSKIRKDEDASEESLHFQSFFDELKIWAENSPCNYEHKYLLLKAEKANQAEELAEAMNHYKQGIASAQKYDVLNIEALGNELYARFWLKHGEIENAKTYLVRAHYLYERWGAKGKVQQLENEQPQWFQSIAPSTTELSEIIKKIKK